MARLVAAFGTSHSTMLFSPLENWLKLFDHIDVKSPIVDFEGAPQPFEAMVRRRPPDAAERLSPARIRAGFAATAAGMNRLEAEMAAARLDALVIVGDDQREIFKDACRPAIAIYCGDSIRNAAAPSPLPEDWYYRDQTRRLEDGEDVYYPCDAPLGNHLIQGLTDQGFDITAVRSLTAEQFEGHAYSFVHRRYMRNGRIPVVPVFLNTYYPPNVPTPRRCIELGQALRALIDAFPADMRVGVLASGGLSHFLVNEALDQRVIKALRDKDLQALAAIPEHLLRSGSSEIRNWMVVTAAIHDLPLQWLSYVPAYRSQALSGVGLCFAHWGA
jgi:Catalytic LigB subunit of aromatic ring-opening dioxygenase